MRSFATVALLSLSASGLLAQKHGGSDLPPGLRPGPDTFQQWGEFIQPSAQELSYERIGWRNKFWPAVEEARRLGRPILLWTMNGHPLGCT